jgi:hypothetical protein
MEAQSNKSNLLSVVQVTERFVSDEFLVNLSPFFTGAHSGLQSAIVTDDPYPIEH